MGNYISNPIPVLLDELETESFKAYALIITKHSGSQLLELLG
jgi:hypothetical protein